MGEHHGYGLQPVLRINSATPATASIPGSMITHSAPGIAATR